MRRVCPPRSGRFFASSTSHACRISLQLEVPRAAHVNGTATPQEHPATRREPAARRHPDRRGARDPRDVQKALRLQSASRTYRPLGHILVTRRSSRRRQLLSVLERHQRYSKIGEILVKTQVITRAARERARRAAAAGGSHSRGRRPAEVRHEEQVRRRSACSCTSTSSTWTDRAGPIPPHAHHPRFARRSLVVAVARSATRWSCDGHPTRTAVVHD